MEDETSPRPPGPHAPHAPPALASEHEVGGEESASKRASVFPSITPPPGPNYRIAFAIVWVTIQAALIVTAGRRSDGAFGFRMFNESSTVHIALYREVTGPDGSGKRVHVGAGVWTARASDGTHHRLSWYDRVPTPYWIFDQEMHASYGADTQLSRLQGALDDVTGHLSASEDAETRRLVLDVMVRRNGREPVLHRLAGPERSVPAIPGREGGR